MQLVLERTTGKHATAKVTVDKNKCGITAITIMNPGSAFGIGNTMYVAGIGTHKSSVGSGHSAAKIIVTKIESNIGDTIRISGVSSEVTNNIMICIAFKVWQLVLLRVSVLLEILL